jgi:hypothetical protein
MEAHAHVPKVRSSIKHWLVEGVFIALSVGLGFCVSGLRERNQNRELAPHVLRALDDELMLLYDENGVLLPLYKKFQPIVHAAAGPR